MRFLAVDGRDFDDGGTVVRAQRAVAGNRRTFPDNLTADAVLRVNILLHGGDGQRFGRLHRHSTANAVDPAAIAFAGRDVAHLIQPVTVEQPCDPQEKTMLGEVM